MLTRLEIQLKVDGINKIPNQKAVLLQSILLGKASQSFAEKMHISGLHPYSQAVGYENGRNIWKIHTLNDESYNELIVPMENADFYQFEITHNDWNVVIVSKQKIQISESEMMEQFYFSKGCRYIYIKFCTPTSFKTNGSYVIYPRVDLLYKSIFMKYEAASKNETLYSDELLEQMINSTQISSYRLQSCMYHIGKVPIPAFLGEITLRIGGPQSLVNFIHFLLQYGEFCGVGVKAGMGMGNIVIGGRER
ncbi:MAG: CRISPR system precrRNA processing endoribonuclease RAMP protein Cas6 [Eubacteriales bacterium]|nr:CRISPR system precrRNA processing endoribonuclease RAMP protein Cas6 [Eubacteriales bacterium]